MIRTQNARRGGFTLVELLVGMSIFLLLAGLVLLLYPGARDQDRVRYTVSDITAHLRMAQSMAARDKAPRGIRFLVNSSVSATSPDPTNDLKKDPLWVTELQYIEQPAPLIAKRSPLSNSGNTYDPTNDPRVRFDYTAAAPGTITARTCVIENLDAGTQAPLVEPGCILTLPEFGFWSKITGATPSGSTVTVTLEVYPDAVLGGSTQAQTYFFAVYRNAIPLVGEPLVQLPRNVCVDLHAPDTTDTNQVNWKKVGSIGPPLNTTSDFNVLFTPDGKLLAGTSSQVFLHVRDFTKVPTMQLADGTALLDAFQKGGEQFFITVRSSGAIAFNNVAWPDTTGVYTGGPPDYGSTKPFALARDQGR